MWDFFPEFFELISKAQSSRADDQRGLLRKEDLVLPEFLRLPPSPPGPWGPAPYVKNGDDERPLPVDCWEHEV